jgi:polygalacturonase
VPSRTYRRYESGTLAEERPFTDAENTSADQAIADKARRVTQAALLEQACADLATNQTYLDTVTAGTATTDDAIAQVAELTRQALGFIRLTVGGSLLDETTGG